MAMLPSLLLLLILPAAPAGELAAAGGSAGAVSEAPFTTALEQGKQLYFVGRSTEALDALLALRGRVEAGEEVPREGRSELLIWLGEVQWHLGRTDEARESFRRLLRDQPDYPISPYAHPLEVVGEFELLRREVLDQRERSPLGALAPGGPPPPPAWVWAPFGVPQFAQRRVGAGLVFGGLQLGFGAASVALYVHLDRHNRDPFLEDRPPTGFDPGDVRGWSIEQRRRYQWPVTAAFYGTWLASSLEARRHWRRSHGPSLTVGPLPRGGSGVLLTTEF
jgi:hypothetical protein